MTTETKTIRVEVTDDDIAYGLPFNSLRCPVAIAMKRAFKFPIVVTRAKRNGKWVGVATVPGLQEGDAPVAFRLSQSVGKFIGDFDNYMPVEPFAFRVWR